MLEKLAIEGGGAWVLAKIDVDANPRIAQAFRVQGIPMVFAVVGGQPVDAFTGVMPEAQLRQWIDAVLQGRRRRGGAAGGPGAARRRRRAVAGDLDEAERAYKKILVRAAGRRGGRGRPRPGRAAAPDRRASTRMPRWPPRRPRPDDLAAQTLAADVEVISGQAERAYERLVDLVRRTAGEDRDKARDAPGVAVRGGRARTTRPSSPPGAPSPTRCSEADMRRIAVLDAPSNLGLRPPTADARCRAARRRRVRCATTGCWRGSAPATPAATRRRGSTRASGGPATA